MPEIKTGNAGNQAQGGRALSSQPVFHAQFPVGKQEYAEFGQAPYVWLIKFHLFGGDPPQLSHAGNNGTKLFVLRLRIRRVRFALRLV